jgi:hypothetical protein
MSGRGLALPGFYNLYQRFRRGSKIIDMREFRSRAEHLLGFQMHGHFFATPASNRKPAQMFTAFQPNLTEIKIEVPQGRGAPHL